MPPVRFEPTISAGEWQGRAARLLRSWVRIPPGAWIFVCCECRVFSGRGLCDELITRPEEPYRLCCVVVCDLETSRIGAPYIYDISRLRVNCKKLKPNQTTPNYIFHVFFPAKSSMNFHNFKYKSSPKALCGITLLVFKSY